MNYQKLSDYLLENHGLIPLESDLQEIVNIVQEMPNETPKTSTEVVIPSIYSMKLHEIITLNPISIKNVAVPLFSIMRVAGGWIYLTWDTETQIYIRETFVPFDNEFIPHLTEHKYQKKH